MTEDEIGRLIYLGVILLVLLGSFIGLGRINIGKNIQQAFIWIGIFAMLIIAYGQRDVLQRELFPEQVQLPQITGGAQGQVITLRRSIDGSFRTQIEVNGTPIRFLVDTGATDVVLTQTDARRVGLDPDRLNYSRSALTANGRVGIAPVRLNEVRFAGSVDRNVGASVNQGELGISLLGMSYLGRFKSIEIRGNQMILIRR